MVKRAFNPGYICDDAAYQERLAIVLESDLNVSMAIGSASDCGYGTPWSKALTAAYRGDWAVVNLLAEGERQRHGDDWALAFMETFKAELKLASEWKKMLAMGK